MSTTTAAPTRLRDLAEKGGQDLLRFNPLNIEVEPGHNARIFDTPQMRERLDELKASIALVGVMQPLRVRYDGGRCVLVDGESRLRACLELITEGIEILSVPVMQVKGGNEMQRILDSLISNTGRPLSQVESGTAFQRLVNLGCAPEDIAAKVGQSLRYVNDALQLFDAPQEVKRMVADKVVTVGRAVAEVKLRGTAATETLKVAVEKQKATGSVKPLARSKAPAKNELMPAILALMAEADLQRDAMVVEICRENIQAVRDALKGMAH